MIKNLVLKEVSVFNKTAAVFLEIRDLLTNVKITFIKKEYEEQYGVIK